MKQIGLIFVLMTTFKITTLAGVLYIGDSHSYISSLNPDSSSRRFGNVLIDGLRAQGHQVFYYAACGSSATSWTNGGSTSCGYTELKDNNFQSLNSSRFLAIDDIYVSSRHTYLFINLGDNMFSWVAAQGKRQASLNLTSFNREIDLFLNKIPTATTTNCAWIGPTYHIEGSSYRKSNTVIDELYAALEAKLSNKCRVIDSRDLVVPVAPSDGLHHIDSDSRRWAQGVLLELNFNTPETPTEHHK